MKLTRRFEQGRITENRRIAPDHYMAGIALPATFKEASPGQFVMVKIGSGGMPFLARPFSIYGMRAVGAKVLVEILYRVAGRGTNLLASQKEGDAIGVLGPLGNGFYLDPRHRKIVLVAGGVGVAPLTYLAQYIQERSKDVCEVHGYFGAQTESLLAGLSRFEASCHELRIATDDGSCGFHGTVTGLIEEDLRVYGGNDVAIYACGPRPMLQSLAKLTENGPCRCQISVEERMACGLGACMGCAVKVKSDNAMPRYLRVCSDGPVFDIEEIDWNDS